MISSGVSVPYSDEYRELRSNPAALETIASLSNGQFTPGRPGRTAARTSRGP